MNPVLPTIVSATALFLTGCSISVTAKLYPVKGPYAEQRPIPILKAQVNDVQRNSGDVTITMPDGEVCTGSWSSLAPQQVSTTGVFGQAHVISGLQTARATVYGAGSTISNVPGVNKGTAYLVGNRGTTVEVEFYTGSGTASGNGAAIDSRGNIYKVIF